MAEGPPEAVAVCLDRREAGRGPKAPSRGPPRATVRADGPLEAHEDGARHHRARGLQQMSLAEFAEAGYSPVPLRGGRPAIAGAFSNSPTWRYTHGDE